MSAFGGNADIASAEQTLVERVGISALCQKRTLAGRRGRLTYCM